MTPSVLPSSKTALLLLIPAAALVLWPSAALLTAAGLFDVGLLGLLLLDVWTSAKPDQITIERRCPANLSLGADNRVVWIIVNASAQDIVLELTEDVPPGIEAPALPMTIRMLHRARAEVDHAVRPTARGAYEIGAIHGRYPTRLGLARRQFRRAILTPIKVYPNVAELGRYELAARRQRLTELGLKVTTMRGQGTQFESLRDYVAGDDPADIAWKATARRGRLITRNFETERQQNVVLLLDCGRLMSTQVERLSRLDYAINASILLAHVAVKQADRIGVVAFSDRIESFMPQMKGRAAIRRLNDALYKLEPRLCESNYEHACRFLAMQHRKRSLIVMFTDVIDPEASSVLLAYMARFARYHLPLCVTMRNLEVEAIAGSEPVDAEACYEKAVALEMLERRAAALARMRAAGVDVLDVNPTTLTPRLIERYLRLKLRARL